MCLYTLCLIPQFYRKWKARLSTMGILWLLLLTLDTVCIRWTSALPERMRIGGLFDDSEDASIELAFRYAIFRVNQDKTLLSSTSIGYDIQHLPSHNSFLAAKKACNQAGLGVAAIFGPRSPGLAGHINSMCNTLEIPHLEARLEPRIDNTQLFAMNMYPESSQLSRAYLDVLKHFDWKKFCVIYGDQSDLLQLQDIIRAPLNTDVEITVRQAKRETMRETLKEIDKKGVKKILAHLSTDDTYFLLKAALEVGMINPSHHYLLTNLDIETIPLDEFKHNFVNITGFRLVNGDEPRVTDILRQMEMYQSFSGAKLLNTTDPLIIKTDAALMYDAVHVLAHALQQVDKSTRLRLVNLSCDGDQAWAFGSSLYNYLNLVGHWTALGGINFTVPFELIHSGSMFGNATLTVTSILEPPYVMKKESEQPVSSNDRYEGFCVDMLKEIANIVGFKYHIELIQDGMYGAPDKDDNWNGMVRQLIDKKADLAVASLTINYLREQVIDFTKPFMNLGISILFKRPRRESPGLFSFLNPLAIEIWLYVIAAYLVVSLMMFVLARFSPYEWYNPHPCNPDHDVVENVFTLSNSFWFAVGTLMQQGSDINPRAVSTRIVGGIWWFFTLIIISSYTANLAAFLTVERMVSPIESAEDLSKQTKIAYGTIGGGSTMTFFRESKIRDYQRMWAFMENHKPDVFVKVSKEGVDRVLKGDYAFLMESTMIDYTIQRNCDLMQVGGLLDSKGYGIGTQIDSLYRDRISLAILELQEAGRIQMLYNKWWKNTGTCNNEDKKQESKANSLGVENVGGIFVVLFVGLALAVISAVAEFVWNSRRNANAGRVGAPQSLWSEMMEELRFAVRCHGSAKKPALRRQCSKCIRHANEPCTVDSPNGVIQLKDINKSPMGLRHDREIHSDIQYRYRDATDSVTYEYRDPNQT